MAGSLSIRFLGAGAAFLAALALAMPSAAGVGVSPILLNIGPKNRVATLTFSNGDDRAAKMVAEVKTRSQPDGQAEVLSDTDDLIVNPPIALVPAGKAQIFRVALRRPLPPGAERAYRLVVTDVTPASPASPDSSGAVSVAVRLSHLVPLYVATVPGGRPSLVIEPCGASLHEALCARVRNNGQAHAQILSVAFHQGAWSAVAKQRGAIVAGGMLRFSVPRPSTLTVKAGFTVAVEVEGQTSPVTGDLGGSNP